MASQVYIRHDDRRRLEELAKRDVRSLVDELSVVITEACHRRGLDPETLHPVDAKPQVNAA